MANSAPRSNTVPRPAFAPFRVGADDPGTDTWLTPGEFQPELQPMQEREIDWDEAERTTPRATTRPWRDLPSSWVEAMGATTSSRRQRRGAPIPEGPLERHAVSMPTGLDHRSVLRIRRPQPARVRVERRVYAGLTDLVVAIGALWACDEFLGPTRIMTQVRSGIGTQTLEQVVSRDRPLTVWLVAAAIVLLNSFVAVALTGRSAGRWLAGVRVCRRRDLQPPGVTRALILLACGPLGPIGVVLAWRHPRQQTIADAVSDTVALTD
jgi:hypothetical protein